MVSLDFKNVDIHVFIKFISDVTDKNFIVGDKVQGKITVISPKKVTVDEAYEVFESVLEVQGFTTVPSRGGTKIVRAVQARKKNLGIRSGTNGTQEAGDRMITQVIPLDYAASQKLRKLLTPMVSKQGLLVDYPPTNTLILTDYQSNIQKILEIVGSVDQKSLRTRLVIHRLEHADAGRIAKVLNNMRKARQQAQGKARAPFVHAVPNERLNSVVVLAEKDMIQETRDLVDKLDQPTPKGEANVHVVRLDNAVAPDLAQVLTNLATAKEGKGKPIISENVQVAADKASNSLVITAKKEEFQALKSVIDELDQPRAQVYVEAAIMEVSADTSLNVGINWQGAAELGDEGIALGSVNQAPGSSPQGIAQSFAQSQGASLGVLSFPFNFKGNTYYNLSSFIQASQTDNKVNIISTPQLLTMENEQAKVVVAENRPFITSREISTDTDREFSNIEYKDVGVTLKVTPQINEKGSVKMDIYQEVSRVEQKALDSGIGAKTPVTSKRTAETRVEVRDGQTAVIAGLIEEKSSQVDTGVPILSQIPGLGWLFKQRTQSESKKNLMVFLTPKVVRSEQDMQSIWSDKKKRMSRLSYGVKGKVEPMSAPFQVSDPVRVHVDGGNGR
ncbi:MAG: type II secretion system secretin GspD [Desulfohalobiaceae bacterium]